ncbi:MAG: DUF5302 domain-containing protein [Actinomycetota bacterium]|nr:DUF5302 domain-containing protein [Actinomycetota bacterium]
MAVDQTKPAGEHAGGEQGPAAEHQAPAPPDQGAKPELDDMKRKFREALDRKRGTHATANAEGSQETSKVHGSHGPAASRRSFRRKSGS